MRCLLRAAPLLLLLSGGAAAEEASEDPNWGLDLSLKNTVTQGTLDKSQDLSYNPKVYTTNQISPSWQPIEPLTLYGEIGLSHEWTNADHTTKNRETLFTDTELGLDSAWELPLIGARASLSLGAGLPSSKFSQAETLILSLSPSFDLSKSFPDLLSLGFGISGSATRGFYRYTTGELQGTEVSCSTAAQCERFKNTGMRNARYTLSLAGRVSFKPIEMLSFGASFGLLRYQLFGLNEEATDFNEDGLAPLPVDEMPNFTKSSDTRDYFTYGLKTQLKPLDFLAVVLGASAVTPQLDPSQDRYTPFFNRHTKYYLDLRLDIAALASKVTES